MLVAFSPIFVVDTKITFVYNFVAPLKELRNCILRIIRLWSVFCSVLVYISLHFLPILLVFIFFVDVSLAFNFWFCFKT